jgi:cytochrome c-type biogenesis protein CcmH
MSARGRAALALAAALLIAGAARGVEPDEILPDAAQEARARALGQELRCLVCQNQSIDDSNAPLARDLRVLVRERIKAGDNDEAVIAYLVARYGDFVRLRPPMGPATWALWFGPPVILGAAAIGLLIAWRRRRVPVASPAPLSEDERKRLDRLLGSE